VERSLAGFIDRKEARLLREQARESAEQLPPEISNTLIAEQEERLVFQEPPSQEIAKLSKEQKRLLKKVRRLFRESDLLEARQMTMLDTSLGGLQQLNYLEGLHLSEKGTWSANLCTSLVLELAELIESGIFENVSAETLVAVIAAICGDQHRQYLTSKTAPIPKDQVERVDAILQRVGELNMPGVSESRTVNLAAANTALIWLQCEDWQQFRSLLVLSDVAEGDAARLITQTAEQLNQITRLAATHSKLSLRAEEGKRRLLRPPLTEVLNLDTV
jgi:superfamily II RNA helicase